MGYDISSKMVRGLLVRDSAYEVTLIRPRFRGFLREYFNGYTVRNYGLLRNIGSRPDVIS